MSKKKKTTEELLNEALVPTEEQIYELPENWIWVKLKTINKTEKRNIDPKNFSDETFELYSVPSYPTNNPEIVKGEEIGSSKQIVNNNEVLLCKINPRINRVWKVSDNKGQYRQLASTEWIVISENTGICSTYLLFLFRSPYFRKLISSNVSGVGGSLTRARPKDVETYPIPIPPLNEQKRIAEKVERLLNKIEEAKQLLEEAKETLSIQYNAVLSKAFNGDFTVKWRQHNDISVTREEVVSQLKAERLKLCKGNKEKEYYNECFSAVIEQSENIPENWVIITLELICDNITKGTTPKTTEITTDEGDIPFLKVYNIVENKTDFEYKPSFIPKSIHENKLRRSIVYPNDVLMNIVGPPLGKVAIVPSTYSEWNINQALAIFRPIKGVLNEYIFYSLLYEKTLSEVFQATRGVVGQSNISLEQCRKLQVALPPLNEQVEIVQKIKKTFEKLKIVENNISNLSSLVKKIEESLLQKAFQGELGTNDPSEENAIELLKEMLQEQVK